MGVPSVNTGTQIVQTGAFGKCSRDELENTITQLKRQRDDFVNPDNSSDKNAARNPSADKRVAEIDNRLRNLESRLEKLKAKQEDKECQTCENRKYQDRSDDPGVSFKTAQKVGAQGAAAAVRGHEYEHVNRDRAKASREGQEVVSQNVRIKTAICPECGTPYIAGGETTTVTKTKPPEKSPDQILEERFKVGVVDEAQKTGQLLNIVA